MTLGCAALTSVENNSRPQLMSQRKSLNIIKNPGFLRVALWRRKSLSFSEKAQSGWKNKTVGTNETETGQWA
jgi:hypothetical protein